MFTSNKAPPNRGQAALENSLQGLCSVLAAMGALLACGTLYDFSFEWAYGYFTRSWGDELLGELAAYGFVGLCTVTVYQLCRLTLQMAVMLLATNVLLRFAL